MTTLPQLSIDDARSVVLRAQGLVTDVLPLRPSQAARASLRRRTAAVDALLRRLGAVQLDTVSVLARSHELVAYSRLGAVGREAIETAYWGGGPGFQHPDEATTFEYWSHAASILPVEEWPLFAFRRRAYARRGFHWHKEPTKEIARVRALLHSEGALTTTQLGGAKKGDEWWDWSDTKVAVEWLLFLGEVVCVRRVGWRRVYDLAQRAIPVEHREPAAGDRWVDDEGVHGPDDATCLRELLARSVRVMGVGTFADVVDVHRLGPSVTLTRPELEAHLDDLVAAGRVVRVDVEGWGSTAYADPQALDEIARARSRTTLLSPFDSLVWHRGRTSRLFGFDYQMELYVPQDKRVHGYYTMPVLHGGRLVARVDPKREKGVLHARQVTFETGRRGAVPGSAVAGTAAALREAASWVGCAEVRLDRVVPDTAAPALHAALTPGPAA
ncbi:MAG TPA: crosslink repair DNA glycosylase YcaQ family protein [Candidatus Nanopelagicales bacterium]|nr:crosslink repair DNA glycosylase YcaQ family protein [Candidatus Nanopelagicales bacterium]